MKILRPVILASLSLAISFVACEVAVRGLDLVPEARSLTGEGQADAEVAPAGESRFLLHPYRGWTWKPGIEAIQRLDPGTNGEENARYGTVSPGPFGFLQLGEDPRSATEDDFVIGIFGGSVASGFATRGAQALNDAVVRRRPELVGKVRIINGAAGSYKQPQALLTLSELILADIPFDVVLEFDGLNEVAFGASTTRSGYHPLYPSIARYALAAEFAHHRPSDDVLTESAILLTGRRVTESVRNLGTTGFFRHSELLKSILGVTALQIETWTTTRERLFQSALQSGDSGPRIARVDHECFADSSEWDCFEEIARIWARSSLLMDALAKSVGARYIHVLQPHLYRDGSKPLSEEEREKYYKPDSQGPRDSRDGYDYLLRWSPWLEEQGVNFMDLSLVYHDVEQTLYIDACCHLNNRAYALIAEPIAELITSSP